MPEMKAGGDAELKKLYRKNYRGDIEVP